MPVAELTPKPEVVCERIRQLTRELTLAHRLLRISVQVHTPTPKPTHRRRVCSTRQLEVPGAK